MAKEVLLTYEGLKKLEDELEYLKSEKRLEVSEKIKVARGFGDLSENAEYDAAKTEQAEVEERIVKLENMLKNAKIIDSDEGDSDTVTIGSTVKVLDIEFDEEVEYTIVGSAEANPAENKISNESPVGSSLINAKIGDTVQANVPDGVIEFKILSITK
ncbi:MAG: transcription elongation factor GreA [Clostridia bacterium]|nr:transcription elongation factor GreA [Clostridia bacterium]